MQSINDLLENYQPINSLAHTINFSGFKNKDVYNISAPFTYNNKRYILGRVESRDSEEAIIAFFSFVDDTNYIYDDSIPTYQLQDPFFSIINNEFILGGVQTIKDENNHIISWCTIFYSGFDLKKLSHLFTGPESMKDLRLFETNDNKVLVLTRPQGIKGGRGKIGAFIIDNIRQIDIDLIEKAPILPIFNDIEWGGCNAAYLLSDNSIGILGHIARFEESGDRSYISIAFELSYPQLEISNLKIIALRSDFNEGPSKRNDLVNVIFSGGLDILDDNKVNLYVGVSDAEAQYITIYNPFTQKMIR